MIAYLATDLTKLMRDLVALVMKEDLYENNSTSFKLSALDVEKKENQLPAKRIGIGNAAEATLTSSGVSSLQKMEFKKECCNIVVAVIGKLQQRCPLKYSLVRSLISLDPQQIAKDKQNAIRQFKVLVSKFLEGSLISAARCDSAEREYRSLVEEEMPIMKSLNPRIAWINSFLTSWVTSRVIQMFGRSWKCALFYRMVKRQ